MRRLPLALCPAMGALTMLVACAPELDWREVRPADSALVGLMPCKPDAHERRVELAGRTTTMRLHSCSASGTTWALSWLDVAEPAQTAELITALRSAAAANVGAATGAAAPRLPAGATPHVLSGRSRWQGRRPDGAPVALEQLLFVHGLRVYQAMAIGAAPPPAAVETFFGELRVQG